MNLQILWRRIAERIDELALRERTLLFLVMLGVLYFLAQTLLFGPLQARRSQLLLQLQGERNDTLALTLKTQTILNSTGETAVARAQLAALNAQLAAVNASLQSMTQGLVTPREMLALVRAALAHSTGVRLVSLENLPATPAVAGQSEKGLYRHGLKIVIDGRYPDLVRYLTQLEGLHWKVFWDQAELKVRHYPTSRLTLIVYTLSLRQAWIGA